jgi:hypothetical protein
MKQITIAEAIQRTVEHREVFHDEMLHVMRQIMRGELSPAQIAGFIIGLRVKKETIGEIAAAAQVMRELATHVEVRDRANLVDTCGTGGDAAQTFNVSTCTAFVAAAAGARVAKHMGRSVSSSSGSAEVLEALGANTAMTPAQTAEAIDNLGVGFMFARAHHSAMKYAAPVRKELGVRTIFNILGPLTNPAGAQSQVLGVYDGRLVTPMATVLTGSMEPTLETGSVVIDDNGLALYSTGFGHPDGMFVSDIDPTRPGMEIFYGIEDWHLDGNGVVLVDAATGKTIWNLDHPTYHIGAVMVADIDPSIPGLEVMAWEDPRGGTAGSSSDWYMLSADGRYLARNYGVPPARGRGGSWGGSSR